MADIQGEQGETIEFLKIRLMEKDRQISDFEAKTKKSQFKHNRDLKELKTAEERAKQLLKDEKAKVDKITKEAKENKEQNALLIMRLSDLKQDRDREVAEVRSQYNAIKEQVRTYERILPTLTFLNQLGLKMEEIPTYQDIFTNLREKLTQLQSLNLKFQTFKAKTQESINTYEQNQQMLRNKKIEAQKNLKEILPKIVEYEHQINDLRLHNQQLSQSLSEVHEQLTLQQERNQNLQDSVKDSQHRLQQLSQAVNVQLHQKQQQIKVITQQQFERYQQELKTMQHRLQIKDNMYIEQIHILQEEVNYLQSKMQTQKDLFQQNYVEIRDTIQTMKDQVDKEKHVYEQLNQKYQESISNLVQVSRMNEQHQDTIRRLEKKLLKKQKLEQQSSQMLSKINQDKLGELEHVNEQLQEKVMKMDQSVRKLVEERDALSEQIGHLRNQMSYRYEDREDNYGSSLDIPANILQYTQRLRRSIESEKHEQESVLIAIEKDFILQRRKTMQATKHVQQLQKFKDELENQQSQDKNRLDQFKKEVGRLLEQQREQEMILKESKSFSEKLEKELGNVKREKQKYLDQCVALKEKIVGLTKAANESEKIGAANVTKLNLLKSKIESLQSQIKIMSEESKKDKELHKTFKQQTKQLREANTKLMERYTKETKELSVQNDLLKQQKAKYRNQFGSIQKGLNHQTALLKNSRQLQEKLRDQIERQKRQIQEQEKTITQLEKKYSDILKELEQSKNMIEIKQDKINQKNRQIELLSESLDRERKERTLRTVPSLHSINSDQTEDDNFNQIYALVTKKEGEINILQRQKSDLKQTIQTLKLTQIAKLQAMQAEQTQYIQTIITMKLKCAQSQMKASQKQSLYYNLRRRMQGMMGK